MKILIATDGSEFSRAAISGWCEMAGQPESTEIRIISVYQSTYVVAGEPFNFAPEYLEEFIEGGKKYAEHLVKEAEEMVRARLGERVKITKETFACSQPEQRILDEAQSWQPDIIVVGSHRRSIFGRMLGSVSDAVVHHAACSVLIGREKEDRNANREDGVGIVARA